MKTRDYREGLLKRLRDPHYAVDYLTDVIANEGEEDFLIAIRDVIDARGENISAFSKKAGITRQALYHALSKNGNPRISTVNQVLKVLGLQLSVKESDAT